MLLLLSLSVVLVEAQQAQIQVPDCLPAAKANWNWTYNTLEQAPCTTAGYMAAECNNGNFTIPKLVAGNHYTGPTTDDKCQCNSVLYSVISACAGCQKGTWLTYDQWTANCGSPAAMSTFPEAINNDTRIPAWAFLNVTPSEPWDNITACDFGGSPESVGTFRPSFAPKFSSGAALSAGVIAGVVAGSTVAGFAAIAAGVWYLCRRRRSQRAQKAGIKPSPSDGGTPPRDKGYESVPWTPQSADMKFYDPKDPSTYPKIALIPNSGEPSNAAAMATQSSLNTSNESRATTRTKPPQQTIYQGLPEV
jgi:hypothetical protein